jgi:hypothetical protein
MKRLATILTAATLALAAPLTVSAQMDHSGMHGGGHGDMMATGKVAHEEVIDGIKATFEVLDMREQMKGAAMPKGMKETHHVMVAFTDAKSGKKITEGEVKVKIQGPDKAEQTRELMGMQGHFGADFNLAKKGKYGIMAKFKLKDGAVKSARFWYEVK